MGFLKRTIQNSIRRGISEAIGDAMEKAVAPAAQKVVDKTVTPAVNKAADSINQAAGNMNQAVDSANQAAGQAQGTSYPQAATGLAGAFAGFQSAMMNMANQAAMNMKVCPKCNTPTTADKKFCPQCGEALPEETVAQGAVCPSCGKQNSLDTRFCQDCGACVDICPKNIIKLIPESQKVMPVCGNKDKGAQVMKMCKVGCIGCMKCQRECPADAIVVKDNLAVIDVTKCVQCGHCADICPRHIITYFG